MSNWRKCRHSRGLSKRKIRVTGAVCTHATQIRMCRRCPACPPKIIKEWHERVKPTPKSRIRLVQPSRIEIDGSIFKT